MNDVHCMMQPYQCKECLPKDVRYANKAGWDGHNQNVHEQVRNFPCRSDYICILLLILM